MPHPFHRILASCLVGGGMLSAAEPMTPGLHLSIADAQGDFRNEMGSKHAPGLGLSLGIPLTRTLAVRPMVSFQSFTTLDYQYAYKSSRYSDLGAESARWSAWTMGADCLYRPGGPTGRLYFLAGAHMKVWRLHSFGTYTTSDRVNPTRTYTVNDASTKDEPALAAGLGWTFLRHVSVESRYVFGSYRGLTYNTLEASLVLTY